MKKVICVAALGDYRIGVIRELEKHVDDEFEIVSGTQPFDLSIKTLNRDQCEHVTFVDNCYLAGRRFMVQRGTFSTCVTADNVVVDLNPRVLNVWLVLLLRRLSGKRSVVWGHAWPRGGASSRSDKVRALLRNLGGTVVVYTESQVRELKERFPRLRVIAAPNALYRADDILKLKEAVRNGKDVWDIVYVGRLVKEKKPAFLLGAFAIALRDLPPQSRLLFVGDGPEADSLKAAAHALGIDQRVTFTGHVAGREQLQPIYRRSLVSVSAGYVGLSITQSFSFGVPMLISKDEPHAPEIEAAVDGVNCEFFETDSAEALAAGLLAFFQRKEFWLARYDSILQECAERYSTEVMADRLLSVLGAG